ncbi:hypothetical protein KOW79_016586 [Hemibagrus wyckioides]|uniref:Uncharacterized protein n=1 Tax=Hemibagrus wyckioides TaxID=337641 RepID=A0A9D3SHA1_9TELE|nr:hypothetical protein KOW79_016586 [Hemibagrus wyckioides]
MDATLYEKREEKLTSPRSYTGRESTRERRERRRDVRLSVEEIEQFLTAEHQKAERDGEPRPRCRNHAPAPPQHSALNLYAVANVPVVIQLCKDSGERWLPYCSSRTVQLLSAHRVDAKGRWSLMSCHPLPSSEPPGLHANGLEETPPLFTPFLSSFFFPPCAVRKASVLHPHSQFIAAVIEICKRQEK